MKIPENEPHYTHRLFAEGFEKGICREILRLLFEKSNFALVEVGFGKLAPSPTWGRGPTSESHNSSAQDPSSLPLLS